MRALRLLLVILATAAPTVVASAPERPVGRDTMKQRLSSKASDPQRVDDCKVPEEKRDGTRPTACRKDNDRGS